MFKRYHDMKQDFTFKRFSISQDRCGMKVGTDGVLLGAWSNGGKRVLDIGTGTGLIALMMAQRFEGAVVDAVEIDGGAASQASENVSLSPFHDRVHVINSSIQDYSASSYNCIVSNPPYFQNSLKNVDKRRVLARHADLLSYRDLFKSVIRLLDVNGCFSAVIPVECYGDFVNEALLCGLLPTREYHVKTKANKSPKRCLLEFRKSRTDVFDKRTVTMFDEDGEGTEWYSDLVKDFYL